MNMNKHLPEDVYFYLFADCILTKGYTRTMITDTSRKELHFVDNSYYEVLLLCRQHKIGEIVEMLDTEDDISRLKIFLTELSDKGLGTFVHDINLFPEIEKVWDHPSVITNAIIDVRDVAHDYGKIFRELDELGCEAVEMRIYKAFSIGEMRSVLLSSAGKRFRHLQLVTKFAGPDSSPEVLKDLVAEFTYLFITVHTTPEDVCQAFNDVIEREQRIYYVKQHIDSDQCCGNIYFESFRIPKIKNISENLLYNGCLNRKISVDEHGNIKNCPSLPTVYGNARTDSFRDILDKQEFRSPWKINKDMILECSDCEYRAICTDCRAFIKDSNNILSKPAKCGYDPYTGIWNQ